MSKLQIVIDSVSSTIQILEEVCEKMEEMFPEDRAKFKLDDRLGGSSEVLQRKSIQRSSSTTFIIEMKMVASTLPTVCYFTTQLQDKMCLTS